MTDLNLSISRLTMGVDLSSGRPVVATLEPVDYLVLGLRGSFNTYRYPLEILFDYGELQEEKIIMPHISNKIKIGNLHRGMFTQYLDMKVSRRTVNDHSRLAKRIIVSLLPGDFVELRLEKSTRGRILKILDLYGIATAR